MKLKLLFLISLLFVCLSSYARTHYFIINSDSTIISLSDPDSIYVGDSINFNQEFAFSRIQFGAWANPHCDVSLIGVPFAHNPGIYGKDSINKYGSQAIYWFYIPISSVTYYFSYPPKLGSNYTDTFIVRNQSFTSIKSINSPTFNIYPTITKSIVNITSSTSDKVNVYVYNISGVKILEDNIFGNYTLNVGTLPSGIYFIAFRKENEVIFVQKIIKE